MLGNVMERSDETMSSDSNRAIIETTQAKVRGVGFPGVARTIQP
jgi:hypothetical protein